MKFGVCRFPLVRNVVAHDIYVGLAFYSCVSRSLKDCKVYDCDSGIDIGQGATWPELGVGGLVEDCEGWGANKQSFRVGGDATTGRRASGVVLRRCSSYADGADGFLLTYAVRVKLEDCTSTAAGKTGIHLCGVNGATLSGCTPPFVSTAAGDPDAFALYGASATSSSIRRRARRAQRRHPSRKRHAAPAPPPRRPRHPFRHPDTAECVYSQRVAVRSVPKCLAPERATGASRVRRSQILSGVSENQPAVTRRQMRRRRT